MSEAKHTPGPWLKAERLNGPWWHISSGSTIGGRRCIGGRQAIAAVHGESRRGSVAYAEMFEANARLIAAAPELLAALEVVVSDWTAQFERQGHMAPAWCKQARAAIAKATL